MKEAQVVTWFKGQLNKRYGKRCSMMKPTSGIYASRRGISDMIICLDGCFIAVEIKSPTGKITLIQQNYLDAIIAAGGLGLLLVGKDETIFDRMNNWVEANCTKEV